jgi:hypothetical protein
MELIFEELEYQKTPFGEISLLRRTDPRLDYRLIYEVKLGEDFLMSSFFVEAEEQLAKLGLEQLKRNGFDQNLDIIIGGLGLGYTAQAALNDPAVTLLRTIDVMQPVIKWHQQGILPIGDVLAKSTRSELIHGDFFSIATDAHQGFLNNQAVHAVFLDIDHSPSHWLNQDNRSFYTKESLTKLANKMLPGGVFGLWSNELPDPQFIKLLNAVFDSAESHIVQFPNPYSGQKSSNSVYIATIC